MYSVLTNENICYSNYYIQKRKTTNTKMNYNIINTTKTLQSAYNTSTHNKLWKDIQQTTNSAYLFLGSGNQGIKGGTLIFYFKHLDIVDIIM